MGKFSPEDLWDLLRYEGWGAPIIVLILVLILLWLNKTRLGLMKCPLKKTVNAIFYVLYVLSFFLTVFTSVIRIISFEFIPLLVTLFIFFFLGRKVIASVWEDLRHTQGYFKKIKRKSLFTERYNKNRINKSGVAQELITTILRENPGKVSIYEIGVLLDYQGTLEQSFNHMIYFKQNSQSTIARAIYFTDLGYMEMDINALRAFASLLSEGLINYDLKELYTTHTQKVFYTSTGTRGSGQVSSSGHFQYSEGTDGDSGTYEVDLTNVSGYLLVRKDIALSESTPVAPAEKPLKNW